MTAGMEWRDIMIARQFVKTIFHAQTIITFTITIMENKPRNRYVTAFNLKAGDLAFKEGNSVPDASPTLDSNEGEMLAMPVLKTLSMP